MSQFEDLSVLCVVALALVDLRRGAIPAPALTSA